MAKKFVRTTKNAWDNLNDKYQYNDSIVFIEDAKQIWSNDIYYGDNQLIETTYDNLKILRDNSQLIPGMQYRITDYVTTTTQENTKSAGHQFDIIVTADSENVLNENARAIQHKSEGGGYNETIYDGDKSTKDFFVQWGVTTNPNTDIDTLCIYKTDVSGLDPDSEDFNPDNEGTDFSDVFFYIGNYEYNGESFDVWQKYEDSQNGYYIEGNYHYYLTTPIVENEQITPELYDADTQLFYEPFNAEYILWVNNSISPSDYFSDSNLNAWELKYALDNDITRFAWVDTENGKGVIYYMKDEYSNECPYDFKNIQFVRTAEWFSNNDTCHEGIFEENPQEDKWFYTFSWINENGECQDLSIIGNTLYNDEGYISGVFGNKILECSNYFLYTDITNSLFALSGNIFVSSYLYEGNTFYGCYSNTFGYNCYSNTFGNNCYSNTFGNDCYSNTFGNDCHHNTFGNECHHNTFGNECSYNTFGNECSYNTFGKNCDNNIIDNCCFVNTFSDYCNFNIFGHNCYFIKLVTTNEETENIYQYYQFASGLQGSSTSNMLEITLTPNLEYETKVAKKSNGEIVIYNEADLVPWTYITE